MPYFTLTPLLTDKDEVDSGEGGIDPLGTEPLADALAVKLAPGVRERQRHPRYLTATAVSLFLCSEFEDVVARDGVTEPWLVFEWYVVEGLVRTLGGQEAEVRGLPGRIKAERAIADRHRDMVFVYDAIHMNKSRETVLLREYPSNHAQHQSVLVSLVKRMLYI